MTPLPANSIEDRLYVLRTRWERYVAEGRFEQFIEFAVAVNSLAEYFCDIDRIPADGSWQAKDYPLHESLYRWGPPPPEDFVRNFEE